MAIKVKVTSFNLNYYTLLPPLSLILHSALDILWVKSNWHIATFLCIKNCEVPNLLKRFAWAFISILGISSLIYWNQVIYQQQTNTFPGQCLTTVVWNTSVKMPCFASASNLKDIWFTLPRQLFFWTNISPKNWVRKLKYSSITSFCELSVCDYVTNSKIDDIQWKTYLFQIVEIHTLQKRIHYVLSFFLQGQRF